MLAVVYNDRFGLSYDLSEVANGGMKKKWLLTSRLVRL